MHDEVHLDGLVFVPCPIRIRVCFTNHCDHEIVNHIIHNDSDIALLGRTKNNNNNNNFDIIYDDSIYILT